jgi:hypothetical protein
VQYTRCLLTPVLADIECEGMCLDEEAVEAEYVDAKQLFAALQTEMDASNGGDQLAVYQAGCRVSCMTRWAFLSR